MQVQTMVKTSVFKAAIWIAAALSLALVQTRDVNAADAPMAFVEGTHYERIDVPVETGLESEEGEGVDGSRPRSTSHRLGAAWWKRPRPYGVPALKPFVSGFHV